MRTALLLLFLLALAAVPGRLPAAARAEPGAGASEYFVEHPSLAPVLDRLSLFDVYAAPWFAAVYLLLFVSLIGCLGPRIRLHARALRTPPPAVPRTLSRLPVRDRWETDATPGRGARGGAPARCGRAAGASSAATRGRASSAEKGYLRETGNLLFHVSLVALLVGIALGGLSASRARCCSRRATASPTPSSTTTTSGPGRRFGDEDLVPFNFALDDFRATYTEDGQGAHLRGRPHLAPDAAPDGDRRAVRDPGQPPARPSTARSVYLRRARLRAARRGARRGRRGRARPERAVPAAGADVPVDLRHQGAGRRPASSSPSRASSPRRPSRSPETGRVDVGLPGRRRTRRSPSSATAATSGSTPARRSRSTRSRTAPAGGDRRRRRRSGSTLGETWELPGGGSLTFVETTEWATFQVTQDPGKRLALLASGGMVARAVPVAVRAPPPGVGAGAPRQATADRPPYRGRDRRARPHRHRGVRDGVAAGAVRATAPPERGGE